MRALPALLLFLTACGSTRDVPALTERDPAEAVALDVRTAEDLASRLGALGLDLTYNSRTESGARASGGAVYATAGGELLSVFEYPSETARDADLPFLTGQVGAGGRVYAYGDRLAVAFEGSNADVRRTLDQALDPVSE